MAGRRRPRVAATAAAGPHAVGAGQEGPATLPSKKRRRKAQTLLTLLYVTTVLLQAERKETIIVTSGMAQHPHDAHELFLILLLDDHLQLMVLRL